MAGQGGTSSGQMEHQLRKYLLLMATLVATVTYAAGLNLPGGSWLEDSPAEGRLAGDSILRDTNYKRYSTFYYSNAISFAASLLVSLLLLLLHKEEGGQAKWARLNKALEMIDLLVLTLAVMVLDLLSLMVAYAAGSSHDRFTTSCAAALAAVGVAIASITFAVRRLLVQGDGGGTDRGHNNKEDVASEFKEHEILLLVAIFAATVAYVAGLNPPGGFWRSSSHQLQEGGGGGHAAGDPVLQGLHPMRYRAFFFFNTTAFIASLLAIMRIVDYKKLKVGAVKIELRVLIITALLGLGGAYACGSCRDGKHTAYILGLVLPVLACFFLLPAGSPPRLPDCVCVNLNHLFSACFPNRDVNNTRCIISSGASQLKDLEKIREFIQLLAILAATIAYQAGVDPPGGVWTETGEGHNVGDPILLTTHPARYQVFFYCNSAAFVASLVIMVMLQNEVLLRFHALEAAIILDLFGLMGAYAAGSARDTSTSIYIAAMAGAVLIYVVIHIVFFTLDTSKTINEDKLEKKREVLLLLAILAATITYQAGLTPPGGLWENDRFGHRAGFPVLQDKYPRRYKAFFYSNAASFMASVALIVLLVNKNLYRPGIQCSALFVCMVAGMLGLMGAYAAGSSLHMRTSIVVLVLVAALAAVVVAIAIYVSVMKKRSSRDHPAGGVHGAVVRDQEGGNKEEGYKNYLMMIGVLAASVTYLTGLKPPGSLWREDIDGHSAGNPVLYDIHKHRYNAFFYNNSISFVASVIVIALLLTAEERDSKGEIPLWRMHMVVLLDLLALLVAYAAGSAREWVTSGIVLVLVLPIMLFVWLLFLSCRQKEVTETPPDPAMAPARDNVQVRAT